MNKYTTIKLSKNLRDFIKNLRKFRRETYEDILKRELGYSKGSNLNV